MNFFCDVGFRYCCSEQILIHKGLTEMIRTEIRYLLQDTSHVKYFDVDIAADDPMTAANLMKLIMLLSSLRAQLIIIRYGMKKT